MTNDGGRTRLWLNDGTGRFTDATDARMPDIRIRFSWDLELADVDNDDDLDVLVSCKRCPGSHLFRNDGAGTFTDDPRALPQYTNNYEFEPMDLDGDGFLDLVTINDGEIVGGNSSSRREHVFRNDGKGRFRDATDAWWPPAANVGEDDNMVAFLDFDSDGDADFVIGSLSGPDRLLINDGTGPPDGARSTCSTASPTPGTLGIALADLDGDGRIDVVQGAGRAPDGHRRARVLGPRPGARHGAAVDDDGRRAASAGRPARRARARARSQEPEPRHRVEDASLSSGPARRPRAKCRCGGTASTCGARSGRLTSIVRRRTACARPTPPATPPAPIPDRGSRRSLIR